MGTACRHTRTKHSPTYLYEPTDLRNIHPPTHPPTNHRQTNPPTDPPTHNDLPKHHCCTMKYAILKPIQLLHVTTKRKKKKKKYVRSTKTYQYKNKKRANNTCYFCGDSLARTDTSDK